MPTNPSHWEMVDDAMAAILRQKTPAQRLAMVFDMADFVWTMIQSNLSATHPDWTLERIQHETARRVSHGAV
jgi:Rv0078B-related antitoxin